MVAGRTAGCLLVAIGLLIGGLATPALAAEVPLTPGELLFYNSDDGDFNYYTVRTNGVIVSAGHSNYLPGWSTIVAVDLDGDGHDERLFYRDT